MIVDFSGNPVTLEGFSCVVTPADTIVESMAALQWEKALRGMLSQMVNAEFLQFYVHWDPLFIPSHEKIVIVFGLFHFLNRQ